MNANIQRLYDGRALSTNIDTTSPFVSMSARMRMSSLCTIASEIEFQRLVKRLQMAEASVKNRSRTLRESDRTHSPMAIQLLDCILDTSLSDGFSAESGGSSGPRRPSLAK